MITRRFLSFSDNELITIQNSISKENDTKLYKELQQEIEMREKNREIYEKTKHEKMNYYTL